LVNTEFTAVLAKIHWASLLTPKPYRSWFTVGGLPLVTRYTNGEYLLNTTIVGHINEQSNTVRQFPRRLCKFPVDLQKC